MSSFSRVATVSSLQTLIIFFSISAPYSMPLVFGGAVAPAYFIILFIGIWGALVSVPFVIIGSCLVLSLPADVSSRKFLLLSGSIALSLGTLNIIANSFFRGKDELGGLNKTTLIFLVLPVLVSLTGWLILSKKYLRIISK